MIEYDEKENEGNYEANQNEWAEYAYSNKTDQDEEDYFEEIYKSEEDEIFKELLEDGDNYARSSDEGWFYDDDGEED